MTQKPRKGGPKQCTQFSKRHGNGTADFTTDQFKTRAQIRCKEIYLFTARINKIDSVKNQTRIASQKNVLLVVTVRVPITVNNAQLLVRIPKKCGLQNHLGK